MKYRGFVALMSAIIISAILLAVVVSGSLAAWDSRFNVLDAESKSRSATLADACVDAIRLKLSYDATYGGGETVPLGGGDCVISAAQNPYGTPRIFPLQTVFNHAYTNLLVGISIPALTISSWREVDKL